MPNALVQKTYIPVHEAGAATLTRKFRDSGLTARNNDIDGFNVFTAAVDPSLRKTLGIENEHPFELSDKGWENLWETAGIPSPGKLPSGCAAIVSFAREPRSNKHSRVEVERIERHSGILGSTIVLALRYGAEANASGAAAQDGFLVAVLPKTSDWTYSLTAGTPLNSPALVTDFLNSGDVQASAPHVKRSFMQSVRRAAGLDTSPEALGYELLKEHGKFLLSEAPSQKCFDLVNAGADLTLRDNYGQTILHKAAGYGHPELVKLLLAKGADIDAKASDGGYDAESMAQDVADNVRYRTNARSKEAFAKFTSIVRMIQDERAARMGATPPEATPEPLPQPAAAAPDQDNAPAETPAPHITVLKPLVFKKSAGAQP